MARLADSMYMVNSVLSGSIEMGKFVQLGFLG